MKLTTTISVYLFVVCACIFAGIIGVIETSITHEESARAHHLTRLLQNEMMERVNAELTFVSRNVKRSANGVGKFGDELKGEDSSEIIKLMIESDPMIVGGSIAFVSERNPGDKWMIYVDSLNKVLGSRYLDSVGYNYTEMDWFVRPLRENRPMWSAPYFDDGAGNCLMITYSIPVHTSDMRGVITADVKLSTFTAAFRHLRPYPSSRSFLFDQNGNLIGSEQMYGGLSDTYKQLIKNIGVSIGTGQYVVDSDSEGNKFIVCNSELGGVGITVCTVTPYEDVVAIFKRLKLPVLIVLAAGFLLLLIGIRSVLHYVSRPLGRLTEAAVEIGNGKFNCQLPDVGKYTDIRKLREAMRYMLDRISGYIGEIERNARESERIQSELDIASDIQMSMLPAAETGDEWCAVAALLKSAREVSGDMYDYVKNRDSLYFIIADVSGKGMPASLVMSGVHSLFRFAVGQGMAPSAILRNINRLLCDNNTSCMFVTAIVGKCDYAGKTLTLSNAGHNPPVMYDGEDWDFLKLPQALPLGVFSDTQYADQQYGMESGGRLLLYTDGLTEAENETKEQYGDARLLTELKRVSLQSEGISAQGITAALHDSVTGFAEAPLGDDITLMCVAVADRLPDLQIYFRYDIKEVLRLHEFITQAGDKYAWGEPQCERVRLILEEAVVNVILHSCPASEEDRIEVIVWCEAGRTTFLVSDSGPAFNPLEHGEVDTSLPVERREPGGLGIYLIKKLSDSLEYVRKNGRNNLKITIKAKI